MEKPALAEDCPMNELHKQISSCNTEASVAKQQEKAAAASINAGINIAELAHVEEVPLLKPILCTFSICLGSFVYGTVIGWPSPAVYNLNSHASNPFFLSSEENSWVGSIATLGAMVGGLIGGPSMDAIGRKTTMMVWLVPLAIGWVIIIASPNYPCLLVGRTVTGIGMGIMTVVCPVYIGEVAPIKIRGLLGSCHQMMLCVGILITYLLGAFLDWNTLAIYCVVMDAIMIIVLCFIPESPRWLVSKDKKLEAEEALHWLHGGPDYSILPELMAMDASVKASADKAGLKDFAKPELWKPLVISLVLMVIQQFSGINVVMMYMVQIFQTAGSSMDVNTQSIIVAAVGMIGTLVSVFISDLTGRKALLIMSSAVLMATMAGMGTFFYEQFLDSDYANAHLSWLPVLCMVLYNFAFNAAVGPIPWVLMGEIFPQRAKGLASSLSTAVNWLFAFIMTKYFTDLSNLIGTYGAYWFCCVSCFLAIPFVVIFVPETKGKSFEEIERAFK